MLPKKYRINKKLFEDVAKKGKFFPSRYFSLKITPVLDGQSRFAFVIPLKIAKNAVVRNKIKRRARSIVQKIIPIRQLAKKKQINAIIFFKKGVEKLTFAELEKEINDIFNF